MSETPSETPRGALSDAVRAEVAAHRPAGAPPFATIHRRRSRRRRALAAATAATAAASAAGVVALARAPWRDAGRPEPTATGQDAATLSCRTGPPFPAAALDAPATAEHDSGAAADALRAFLRNAGSDGEFTDVPRSGWRALVRTDTDALYAAPRLAYVLHFALVDGAWRFAGSVAPCRPVIAPPPEHGPGYWYPERPVGPEDRTFTALVGEFSCASGKPPVGRVAPPVIEYRADAVVVTFFVREVAGDCPSAPEAPYEVTLREPLGDRALLDGHTYPPRPARPERVPAPPRADRPDPRETPDGQPGEGP